MRKLIPFLALIFLAQPSVCQGREPISTKWGVNGDYSFSGTIHSVVIGPALFIENRSGSESEFWRVFDINAGVAWGSHTRPSPVTGAGYYFGRIPGVMFGISSQQYYKVETKYNNVKTDVRLSGEVVLALFGFIGYRYQYPLINSNESELLTRHAIFFRIPIPVTRLKQE
jgi:hypothetical protein